MALDFDIEKLRQLEIEGREMVGCSPPVARDIVELGPQRGGCWHKKRNPCNCECHVK